MHGGYRKGAGRKLGFAAKNAEEARRYLAQRVSDEIEPLADRLLEKALNGDIRAIQILFDRAWGKPRQEIRLVTPHEEQASSEGVKKLTKILNTMPEIQDI